MKESAGVLIYKKDDFSKLRVFLVHPGGPFWKNKDEGHWGIPKGEIQEGEAKFDAAIRELEEETGIDFKNKKKEDFFDLGMVRYTSNGKRVFCYSTEGDWSGFLICKSWVNNEWPPKSGKFVRFPEVDKAGFFEIKEAMKKINPSQKEFIEKLLKIVSSDS